MPFRIKGAGGTIAIYTVPTNTSTDDTPLTDPLGASYPRLIWHGALDYPSVDETIWNGSVTLPARTQNTMVKSDNFLFAHGKPSAPMIFGRINNFMDRTYPIAIAGMLPMRPDNSSTGTDQYASFKRWIGLSVDNTNVYIREYGPVKGARSGQPGVGYSWPSVTLNVSVYVTNYLVDGSSPGEDPSKPDYKMSSTELILQRGKFELGKRYIRKDASNTDGAIPTTKLIEIPSGAGFGFHYNFDGFTSRYVYSTTVVPTFTSSLIGVKV
jgi:hypothetical protein